MFFVLLPHFTAETCMSFMYSRGGQEKSSSFLKTLTPETFSKRQMLTPTFSSGSPRTLQSLQVDNSKAFSHTTWPGFDTRVEGMGAVREQL